MTDRKHLKAGDVWRHPSFGKLYVTDDVSEKEAKKWPGMFKCYWSSGGNPNAPWTFLATDNSLVERMTLVSETAPEDTAT
jgi:hypothetical protein